MNNNNDDWSKHNYFMNYLVDECFKYDVLDTLTTYYKQFCEKKQKVYNRETLQEVLEDFAEELMNMVEDYAYEVFEDEGED